MLLVPVNIRTPRAPKDEEELKLEEQMRELGIPLKTAASAEFEWRSGYLMAEHIEAIAAAGKDNVHTAITMNSGMSYFIKESLPEFVKLLLPPASNETKTPDGKRSYNYTATIS
jgi:hypothetical protein